VRADDLPPLPPDFRVPDYLGPILGWRLWRVDPQETRLLSLFVDAVWEPSTSFTASCIRGHAAPEKDCICGVYALDQLRPYSFRDSAFYRPRERLFVVGTASLWGRVIPGTLGWRAQHARPMELWVVPAHGFGVGGCSVTELARNIAAVYEVPCKEGERRHFFGSA
jgi:hypothetical protein